MTDNISTEFYTAPEDKLQFCSFASGSSGNCYLVRTKDCALLIDAGISGKRIFESLEKTGTPLSLVKAVLVTHEHSDHVQSLPILTKKIPELSVYANSATWSCITRPVAESRRRSFETGKDFYIGSMRIHSFRVSHDAAEPVGFSIFYGDRQITVLTDSGCITQSQFDEISTADLLLLEANHEVEILRMGSYPYHLQQRILGDEGHLSNVSAGRCLCRLAREFPRRRQVLLGHLSRENNTPDVARLAVTNTLEEENIFLGSCPLSIDIVLRDCISPLYTV